MSSKNNKDLRKNRFKIYNDKLVIDPFNMEDYGTYSCLFVDNYGERKLNYKIDETLIPLNSNNIQSLDHFNVNKLNQNELQFDVNLSIMGSLSDGFLRITCESSNF